GGEQDAGLRAAVEHLAVTLRTGCGAPPAASTGGPRAAPTTAQPGYSRRPRRGVRDRSAPTPRRPKLARAMKSAHPITGRAGLLVDGLELAPGPLANRG